MRLLLRCYPEAAKEMDTVRLLCRAGPPLWSQSSHHPLQVGTLPLELALEKNASVEVVAALLHAHPEAEASVAQSKKNVAMFARAKAIAPVASASEESESAGGLPPAAVSAPAPLGRSSDADTPTPPAVAKQASMLVSRLKSNAADAKVLPLISTEVAATRLEVQFHTPIPCLPFFFAHQPPMHSLRSCRCTGLCPQRLRTRW